MVESWGVSRPFHDNRFGPRGSTSQGLSSRNSWPMKMWGMTGRVRSSDLFGRAIEFHRKLDGSSLVRSGGRGAESSHQDCARAQLRWPVFVNFHLSQSRSPDAAIPACAEKESYPLRDVGPDLGMQRL